MVEMKESEIEWIGQIPKHWNIETFKYQLYRNEVKNNGDLTVLSLYREFGIVPKDSRDDNHNVTSEDTSKYKYVQIGDFVVNKMKAWQGSVAVSDYEGIVSPAYFVYSFRNNSFNKKYFHYLLRGCYKDEFRRLSGGIREGQWDLPADRLEVTPVIMPPKEEQNKIAEFLDDRCAEIDAISSEIQEQIETLEEYKRSVITEAVTKGLDPSVEMKDSGIEWVGNIPKHWEFDKAKYHFTNNKYVVGIKSVDYDRLALTLKGVIHRDKEDNEGLQPNDFNTYQLLKAGELVFKLIDLQNVSTSRIGLAHDTGIVSPAYIILSANKSINPAFAEKFFLMMWHREIFNALGDAGVRSSLNAGDLLNVRIPVPPIEEQNRIAEYLNKKCSGIDGAIEDKQKQLETLEEYKKTLIYEYVTGKKEVA